MVLDEESKPVTEVAKTTGKAIDACREAGPFIANVIKGTLVQAFGIIEDKLTFVRLERLVAYRDKCHELMKHRKLEDSHCNKVPLKLAVPILESASMEEDDLLQNIWAKLLVNSMDPDAKFDIKHAFISVLKDVDLMEAKILNALYLNRDITVTQGVATKSIPNAYPSGFFLIEDIEDKLPAPDVQVVLQNLVRLRCLSPAQLAGSGDSIAHVHLTSFGEAFARACSAPEDEKDTEPQS